MEPVDWLPKPMAEVLFWVYYSQDLLTGLITLGVGIGTIYLLWRQLNYQRQLFEEQRLHSENRLEEARQRKLMAARSGAAIALSEITEYSYSSLTFLEQFLDNQGNFLGDDLLDAGLFGTEKLKEAPKYPAGAFKVLQSIIEYADYDDASELHTVIAYGQIQHSRLRSLNDRLVLGKNGGLIITSTNILSRVRDALGMKAHADRCYGFARDVTERIHPFPEFKKLEGSLTGPKLGNSRVVSFVNENWPPNFPRNNVER